MKEKETKQPVDMSKFAIIHVSKRKCVVAQLNTGHANLQMHSHGKYGADNEMILMQYGRPITRNLSYADASYCMALLSQGDRIPEQFMVDE